MSSTFQRTYHGLNLYEVLGVSSDASAAALRKAYHTLALQFHPDKNITLGAPSVAGGGVDSRDTTAANSSTPEDGIATRTQRFLQVSFAYEVLSDPLKRTTYDREFGHHHHANNQSTRPSSYTSAAAYSDGSAQVPVGETPRRRGLVPRQQQPPPQFTERDIARFRRMWAKVRQEKVESLAKEVDAKVTRKERLKKIDSLVQEEREKEHARQSGRVHILQQQNVERRASLEQRREDMLLRIRRSQIEMASQPALPRRSATRAAKGTERSLDRDANGDSNLVGNGRSVPRHSNVFRDGEEDAELCAALRRMERLETQEREGCLVVEEEADRLCLFRSCQRFVHAHMHRAEVLALEDAEKAARMRHEATFLSEARRTLEQGTLIFLRERSARCCIEVESRQWYETHAGQHKLLEAYVQAGCATFCTHLQNPLTPLLTDFILTECSLYGEYLLGTIAQTFLRCSEEYNTNGSIPYPISSSQSAPLLEVSDGTCDPLLEWFGCELCVRLRILREESMVREVLCTCTWQCALQRIIAIAQASIQNTIEQANEMVVLRDDGAYAASCRMMQSVSSVTRALACAQALEYEEHKALMLNRKHRLLEIWERTQRYEASVIALETVWMQHEDFDAGETCGLVAVAEGNVADAPLREGCKEETAEA